MLILVTYDVRTDSKPGRRRLRRIAQACKDFGQRVQYSVFECLVGDKELVVLRERLLAEMEKSEDSLRIYSLDEDSRKKTEHYGTKDVADLEGPLIV